MVRENNLIQNISWYWWPFFSIKLLLLNLTIWVMHLSWDFLYCPCQKEHIILLTIQFMFFFSYVFLTYAFRQYQISPKISFFTSTSPLALCLPFIYFTLKSLAISPRYISGGCLFLSHMQVPLFWITFCVKILQLSFSIYFLKIWSWLFVKLLFLFIYWGTPPCDHTVYTTTSLLIP